MAGFCRWSDFAFKVSVDVFAIAIRANHVTYVLGDLQPDSWVAHCPLTAIAGDPVAINDPGLSYVSCHQIPFGSLTLLWPKHARWASPSAGLSDQCAIGSSCSGQNGREYRQLSGLRTSVAHAWVDFQLQRPRRCHRRFCCAYHNRVSGSLGMCAKCRARRFPLRGCKGLRTKRWVLFLRRVVVAGKDDAPEPASALRQGYQSGNVDTDCLPRLTRRVRVAARCRQGPRFEVCGRYRSLLQ